MNSSIFDDNFWVATTVISVVSILIIGFNLDTYLDNELNAQRMEMGYIQCLETYPNGSTILIWKKECYSNKIKGNRGSKNRDDNAT